MPPEWGKGARPLEQESWKVERVTYLFPRGGCGFAPLSLGTELKEARKTNELVRAPGRVSQ